MIFDEPVRGRIPQPWFCALPGIDRVRAIYQGLLPLPPVSHLLGVRAAHIGPGSGTWTMPAAGIFEAETGTLDTAPLQETALLDVATTTLPPGVDAAPLTVAVSYLRPMRPEPGNLLARARVINASRFFVFSEVEIDDPQGRRIAHASSHLELRQVEPPPPPAPAELRPLEEPSYATPDPYLRQPAGAMPRLSMWHEHDGFTIMRKFAEGTFRAPYQQLLPVEFVKAEKGHIIIKLPASEWLCRYSPAVATAAITELANRAGWYAGLTMPIRGQSFVGIDQTTRIFRAVVADGRPLVAEARAKLREGRFVDVDTTVHDSDGNLVSIASSLGAIVDNARRQKRAASDVKRILATLLFTDVVDSTEHARKLGDARWRALLDEHYSAIRQEINRYSGVEVNTTGDGCLIRFEAPLGALECARAIINGVQRLGIEVRIGIHTGECELRAGDVAGLAVHVAARVQAHAVLGEIFVSGIVKDLVLGSGMQFEERGEHALKGVPGEWKLYSVKG
jgi:class 3 adenylate cyclase